MGNLTVSPLRNAFTNSTLVLKRLENRLQVLYLLYLYLVTSLMPLLLGARNESTPPDLIHCD